jgi:catechol 2,3-dioxygenase-like lactoylglutathione lyase family enzyme
VIGRALIAAAVACVAFAQPVEAKGFISITTRDGGRLIAWYSRNFDLRPVRTIRPDGQNLTLTILDGPLATIEILSRPDARPADGQPQSRIGIFEGGFMVEDLAPWLTRWQNSGVTIAAGPFVDDQPPMRSVILADPDGNLIHITAPLPVR